MHDILLLFFLWPTVRMLAEILRDRITSRTKTSDKSTIENSYNLRYVRSHAYLRNFYIYIFVSR